MQIMSKFYGTMNAVPYIEKDIANLRAAFRNEHNPSDIQDTLEMFERLNAEDKYFFMKFTLWRRKQG